MSQVPIDILLAAAVLTLPPIVKAPVLGLYSKAPVSSCKLFDSSWNTTGKSVFAVLSLTETLPATDSQATPLPVDVNT